MKRIFNYMFLLMASAVLALTGCQKEEIVFDHEQPQFEIDAEAILLEVIMPNGTAADEELYITGAFNDNQKYPLEKAENSDKKWGIYLYEGDFADGKTLEDGFYFVSETNGAERTAKGETVTHTLKATYGTRTNVWVASWEAFFKNGDEPIEHDGYVIYVIDETGWDALALYAWADGLPELFGGWPGIQPTGKEVVKGVEYLYFDCGAANTGLGYNLIFNNNNGGTQFNGPYFTIERNIFLKLTATGAEEITPADGDTWPNYNHDGDAIYICNKAGWEECALYAWGSDIPELFGGWPGAAPVQTFEYKNNTWYFFECGASNNGLFYNFIANNNNNGKQIEPLCAYELGSESGVKYIVITEDLKCEEVADYNDVPAGGQKEDPDPTKTDTVFVTVKDTITTHIYLVDESTITMHYLYAWGTSELFGGWPGAKWNEWETANFLGHNFHHFAFNAEYGSEFNLIINNKGYTELTEAEQEQYDACKLQVGAKTDLFYTVQDTKVVEMTPTAGEISVIRRLFRK